MNRISKVFLTLALGACAVGCYSDFDRPAPDKVWTEADFADSRLISIRDFKQLFYDVYGHEANSLAKTLYIEDDYVIRGKVISSDRAGNVYKSLYIYDETSESAIELRLSTSNYVYYHPGQTIFVKTQGLVIGNYRYRLSVGGRPSEADLENGYANNNLEDRVTIEQYVKPGAMGELTAADTLVVNAQNYRTVLNDDALGRLVRFEGLNYRSGSDGSDIYPNYLETLYLNGSSTATYTTKYYKDQLIPGTDKQMPDTYAYSYAGQKYYGSSWFSFFPSGSSAEDAGNYIARVSGYANFALMDLPAPGAVGNMTAIYTKYSSRTGGYIKYQLLINSREDIDF